MAPEWRDDAEHFHRQRRHRTCLRHHDHRHAAHDAVAFGVDARTARGRRRPARSAERCEAARGKSSGRAWVGPDDGEAGGLLRLVGCGDGAGWKPDSPRTTRPSGDGVGEDIVVARQRRVLRVFASSRPRKLWPQRRATCGPARRRRRRSRWPRRPILVSLLTRSATTVRGHGHCPIALRLASSMSTMTTGRSVCFARPQHLKQIEGPRQPQFLERRRVGDAQQHQRRQQEQTDHAARTTAPSGIAVHLMRRSLCSCRALGWPKYHDSGPAIKFKDWQKAGSRPLDRGFTSRGTPA